MAGRQAELTGDIVAQVEGLQLLRFSATERLSEPYTLLIEVFAPTPVDFGPHLGLSVGVEVSDVAQIARHFAGRLFEARYLTEGNNGYEYQLVVKSWLALLDLNMNSRVFQDLRPLQVVQKVLEGYKFTIQGASGDLKRDYCNQYRESDANFVCRLLEEEGFYYFFKHTPQGEEMIICGGPSAHAAVEGLDVVRFEDDQGAQSGTLTFWDWSERITPVPSVVTLADSQHLLGGVWTRKQGTANEAPAGRGPAHTSELFDYPGGNGIENSLDRLAKMRLHSARAEGRRFSGEGDLFALACGAKTTLEGHSVEGWNQDYLIVGATHALTAQSYRSGGGGGELLVTVEATPFATPWRPALKTPKPVVAGPTTAAVIGEGEIDVDEHGRVLVKFMWDRREGNGPENAVRIRVSQGWAGGGYGLQNIPRTMTEVIVDFLDGDPDLPMVTGRLHSKSLKPPLSLPGNKTQSTWKSQTVGKTGDYPETEEPPDGVGFNEIRLEDKGGSEEVVIHAQRTRTDWTRFDENRKVGHNQIERIGYDRKTEIKRHDTIVIETGDETHTVQAGTRKTVIHKAEDLKVEKGDMTTLVEMGNQETQVKMGNIIHKASVGKITVESPQEILLKVGGSSIKIDPAGVTITGAMIKIDGKAMIEAKAGAMMQLDGGGMMMQKAGIIMIN